MPLPDLIEIVSLTEPVQGEITVPGSKSITNRALLLAALAEGEIILRGALWSEDTQVMVAALKQLGFNLKVEADPKEFCNRNIIVIGQGGKIPLSGTVEKPLELSVGNAGTAARFLSALVCLGQGVYRLSGVPRMHERPQAALFKALRELGYRVDSPNDRLPAIIHGIGPREAACSVEIGESSQFASALMLCAKVGQWKVTVTGEESEESPYVVMTQKLIEAFPARSGRFQIEADASSASYFVAANWLIRLQYRERLESRRSAAGSRAHALSELYNRLTLVGVAAYPKSNWQIDAAFPDFLPLPDEISRRDQLGDSIMTAVVMAAFAAQPKRFTQLERLRVQECERVVALRTELTKCGVKIVEEDESLTVYPAPKVLHGAEIETYNDHRMAMCFAILGLKVEGIKIKNPGCVKKTFPNFFQKLAAKPPHGLGVTIRDASGKNLSVEQLFAD